MPMRRLGIGIAALLLWAAVPALAAAPGAQAPTRLDAITPAFTIWDVALGQPVSQIPDPDIVNVACGTNGGPPSIPLKTAADFASCPAEPSGLHEVHFEYDDEQAYIAKALELEYRFLQGGTSVYAHPVAVSVLVDDKGIVRGIRIVTDDHASVHDRQLAVYLADNLRSRFGSWQLDCKKLPPTGGEAAVGTLFIHDICTGAAPDGSARLRLEARYMRLKGQTAINPETQRLDRTEFFSSTRFELVAPPYQPAEPPRASGG